MSDQKSLNEEIKTMYQKTITIHDVSRVVEAHPNLDDLHIEPDDTSQNLTRISFCINKKKYMIGFNPNCKGHENDVCHMIFHTICNELEL